MKTETNTYWVAHRFLDGEDVGYLFRYSFPGAIMTTDNIHDFRIRCESAEEAKTLAASIQNERNLCVPEEVVLTTTVRVRRLRSNFHRDC